MKIREDLIAVRNGKLSIAIDTAHRPDADEVVGMYTPAHAALVAAGHSLQAVAGHEILPINKATDKDATPAAIMQPDFVLGGFRTFIAFA
jgi:hypothetical protein